MSLVESRITVKEAIGLSKQSGTAVDVLLQSDQQKKLLDTKELWAAPGLIDLHTHIFPGTAAIGLAADTVGIRTGVAALVDAGSSGWQNFDRFLAEVVHPSFTKVYAFLNISPDGLVSEKGELAEPGRLSVEKTVECARRYSRYIRGIKARASASAVGTAGMAGIKLAKEAAELAGLPLMVHIGNGPPALDDVLDLLGAGDIVTHCFHGKPGGILLDGKVRPKALAARARGVRFDVGHGSSSLNFAVARDALKQGFYPDAISTDIYDRNINGPVFDLITTVNKFIALGMSRKEALLRSSVVPAKLLGLTDEDGSANLTMLDWQEGPGEYVDSDGNSIAARGKFVVKYVICHGYVYAL